MKDGSYSLDCLKKDYLRAVIQRKENINGVCPQGVQVVMVMVYPLQSKQKVTLRLCSSYYCLGQIRFILPDNKGNTPYTTR